MKEASAAEEQRAIAELRRRPSDEGGMAFKVCVLCRAVIVSRSDFPVFEKYDGPYDGTSLSCQRLFNTHTNANRTSKSMIQ